MLYKTILFDADDTLLDFRRSEHEAIKKVLHEMALPDDEATIATYSAINRDLWNQLELGGITKNELKTERFRRLCTRFHWIADPKEMANQYCEALSHMSYIISGADALIAHLSQSYDLYLVTNGISVIQTRRWAGTPLFPFFKDVFISEKIGYEKPNGAFFDAVAKQIPDYDPSRTLIVGDSLTSDMKGGIVAGIDTCWYNPGNKPVPTDMKITYVVENLAEIETILKKN